MSYDKNIKFIKEMMCQNEITIASVELAALKQVLETQLREVKITEVELLYKRIFEGKQELETEFKELLLSSTRVAAILFLRNYFPLTIEESKNICIYLSQQLATEGTVLIYGTSEPVYSFDF